MALSSSLLAFLCLAVALLRTPGMIGSSPGEVDWLSLGLVVASLVVALVGAYRRDQSESRGVALRLLPIVLAILMASELWLLGTHVPSVFREVPGQDRLLISFRVGVGVLGLLALSYAWPSAPLRAWRFPALLAVFGCLGSWVITTETGAPFIDVWHLQQGACAELSAGRDPYSAEYPNVYGDDQFIGKEILHNGKVQSFPYPPVSLLLALPGYLCGDVRWSLLLAMMATAGFMVATGRRLGLPAGHPVELIALAFLCLPTGAPGGNKAYRGLIMLEMSWTEPFVLLGLTAAAWAMAGGRRWIAALALALAGGAKQYVFICLPAWWGGRRLAVRYLATAIAGAVLVSLPFLIWDPVGLWNGLVRFHIYSPFRKDSLSILSAIALTTGRELSPALGFLAAGIVGLIVARPSNPSVARILLGNAAIFLAFFLLNKAAHLNYHWLSLGLLAAATISATATATGGKAEPNALAS
jgi:hypothetical protein